jgi:hypothetical protein
MTAMFYGIPGLPVGTYSVGVTQPDFRNYIRTDIILIATQVLRLDIRMSVCSTTQTLVVSDGGASSGN